MRLWSNSVTIPKQQGFTLIELLITVVIVGILASVAYPSYMDSVRKTRREEAKRTLVEAAQHLENFYAMNLTYVGAVLPANSTGTLATLTLSGDFNQYYGLTFTSMAASTFTATAAPKGTQAADSCGSLSINSRNTTTAGVNGCW